MSKLTKVQAKSHAAACELLRKDVLSIDDRFDVIENYQESATNINSIAGAFFTPPGLARDFSIEIPDGATIVDLCAGIGALSFAASIGVFERVSRIVCIELNPEYAAVGRKIVPHAEWIVADIFDLPDIGHFDCAIGNPPFGATKRTGNSSRYTGSEFEYHLIDVASEIADYGIFIIPQESAPFRYSGQETLTENRSARYRKFATNTAIELRPNCGIDTSIYSHDWHGVSPKVEIVTADFIEARHRRENETLGPLFMQAAE